MAIVGRAQVLITPTFTGFQRAVAGEAEKAGTDGGKRGGQGLGASLLKWGKRGAIVAGVTAGAALGTALTRGFGRLTAIENAQAKLRGLGHDTQTVETIMANSLEAVDGTFYSLDQAVTSAANAVAAGIKPGEDLARELKFVADMAAIAGTDLSEMDDILGRMQSSGRITTTEMNRLQQRGLPVWGELADSMGITEEALRKMVSAGEVEYDKLHDAMSHIEGAAVEMGDTTSGTLANTWTAVANFGASILEGVFPVLKDSLLGVREWLRDMTPAAKDAGAAFGTWVTGTAMPAIQSTFEWLRDNALPVVLRLRDYVANDLMPAFRDAGQVIWDALGGAFESFGNWFGENEAGISSFITAVGERIPGAIETAGAVIAGAIDGLRSLGEWLNENRGVAIGLAATIGALTAVTKIHGAVLALQTAGGLVAYLGQIKLIAAAKRVWAAMTWLVTNALWKNVAAKIASAAQTIYLHGLYAGQWIATQARAIAGWVRETAVIVANRAALIAQTVARKSSAFAAFLGMQARAIANWLRETVVAVAHRAALIAGVAATKAVTAATWLLNAAMRANPIGIVVTLLVALGAGLVLAWKRSETFRNIVLGVWESVKAGISAAWDSIKGVFEGIKNGIESVKSWFSDRGTQISDAWNGMRDRLSAGATAIRDGALDRVKSAMSGLKNFFTNDSTAIGKSFNWVRDQLSRAWRFIDTNVFGPIKAGIRLVRALFSGDTDEINKAWLSLRLRLHQSWQNISNTVFAPFRNGIERVRSWFSDRAASVRQAWSDLGDRLRAGWRTIDDRVFRPFRDGLTRIGDWVRDTRDRIGTLWDGVANKFRNPINWVIRNVWNDGIASVFNRVADAIGISARLPRANEIRARAKGGFTPPGWTLVGEEGPELVNFSAPSRVYTASETADAMEGRPSPVPAMGGFWGSVSSAVSSAVGGVVNWVRGGLASLATSILNPIKGMIASNTGSHGFGRLVGGMGTRAINELVTWIRGKDDEDVPPAGSPGGWVRPSRGPITSRYGRRNLFGNNFHYGIDVAGGGPVYAAGPGTVTHSGPSFTPWNTGSLLRITHPGGADTLYGHMPYGSLAARGTQVRAGQRIGRQGAVGQVTGTHLHFEHHPRGWRGPVNPERLGVFDQGGRLNPGHAAVNLGRTPEAVLTGRQWDDIRTLASRGGGFPEHVTLVDESGSILTRARVIADDRIRSRERELTREAIAGSGRNRSW